MKSSRKSRHAKKPVLAKAGGRKRSSAARGRSEADSKWLYKNLAALAAVKQGLKESAEGKAADLGSFAKFATPRSALGYAGRLGHKPRRTAAWMRDLRAGEA